MSNDEFFFLSFGQIRFARATSLLLMLTGSGMSG